MQEYDVAVPCLVCNEMVLIRSQDWSPKKVGLCLDCYDSYSLSMIRLVYMLRVQVSSLHNQLMEQKGRIEKLFSAQKEMEMELLGGDS